MFSNVSVRIARTSALFALLVVLPAELHAQEAPPLAPRDRIRVSSPEVSAKQTGRFVSIEEETLVLKRDRTGDTLSVSLAEWSQLERSKGRMHAGVSALTYAGFGVLVGGATGLAVGFGGYQEPPEGSSCLMLCSPGETALFLGMALGIVGGATGALIGAIFPPERWERVALPQGLSLGATAGERIVLSVTLRR